MSAGQFFKEQFLVIVHVSTTCDEQQVCVSRDSAEIIELAWVVIDAKTLDERTQGSVLVRPLNTPVTDLCTSSTTLTWSDLENAQTLKEAFNTLDTTIRGLATLNDINCSFIVLDPFDLRVQIPRESRDKGLTLPTYLQRPRLYDLRAEYGRWQANHPEALLFSPGSLSNICAALDVDTTDLDHHGKGNYLNNSQAQFSMTEARTALDQCIIIHRVLKALIRRVDPIEHHSSLFRRPMDAAADMTSFLGEKSKVLHLSGLAYDTTQSELESWFTQHGGRPIAFWTLRTPDQHKPTGTGYAIFSSHQEALESLSMNGRALGDRTIEVSTSSPRILDRAAEILTPFPPSKNRPRPGDWTCPSCGFSNFQRRTACFRCSYPSGGTLESMSFYPPAPLHAGGIVGGFPPAPMHSNSMRSMTGGHVPFRAGDWTCQNCTYHNFARNSVCLKCSLPRAPQADLGMMRYDDYNNYAMAGIADELARI